MALDPLTAALDFGKTAVDKIWPDAGESERQKINAILEEQRQQSEINKIEAGHSRLFVAGWRPFIGWTCGISFAYCALIEPLARFIAMVIFKYSGMFPNINTEITLQVLLALLGIGGLRTYEKMKGLTK